MKGSVFLVCVSYAWAFALLWGRDEMAWTLAFIFSQIGLTGMAWLQILLRLTRVVKKKRSRIYYLSAMFQFSLMIADLVLLNTDKNMTRTSLLFFFGLNGLTATWILMDLYKYKKPSKG
jgi:hypothetical protein